MSVGVDCEPHPFLLEGQGGSVHYFSSLNPDLLVKGSGNATTTVFLGMR